MNRLEKAKWITSSTDAASPVIQRVFTATHTRKASLAITGIGYFEATLNGNRLGQEYFQPVVSDYEKRDFHKILYPCSDEFTHRIYYRVFDVSDYIIEGENLLSIQLGGGWFVQKVRIAEGEMSFGDRPKCIFALKTDKMEVYSDGSETWQDSEIIFSNLFIGETHDPSATKRYGKVMVLSSPKSILSEQIGVPDRLIRTITPSRVSLDNQRAVFDVGENISGFVRVYTRKNYRGKIILRFAEELDETGHLNFYSTGSESLCKDGTAQIMKDVFICDGKERVFEPKFVWHAFRYFDIEGEFDNIEVLVIHSDIAVTSTFVSDSEGLNFLYDAYLRTQLGNMHGSIPSDCPHRERLGYTGDGQVCAPTAMMLLDSRNFYLKWIQDILDCQDISTGHVQHTAPFQGGGGGPGGWGCAIVLVPYYYWKQYGDFSIIEQCWEAMLNWINYLLSHMSNHLVTNEIDGGWCLGDWCTLDECHLPEPLVNTYYFIVCLRLVREMASHKGCLDEISTLIKEEERSLSAVKQRYLNPQTGNYCDGTQGANVYAAALGLVKFEDVANYYDGLKHFDTGFLGTDLLCELLVKHGYMNTAYTLLTTESVGGFLYMKHHGATTIWETWKGDSSHNHPMFGAAARQLFNGILGIRQDADSYGWEKATISPYLPRDMNYAEGSILTPYGYIRVKLHRKMKCIEAIINVPENTCIYFNDCRLSPGEHIKYLME